MELLLSEYNRVFILYSNTAATAPTFTEETLTTEGGRMDVVARCAIYALWDLGVPRRDAAFIAVLNGPPNPPVTLFLRPANVELSEKALGSEILSALKGFSSTAETCRLDAAKLLVKVKEMGFKLALLIENGEDISRIPDLCGRKTAFVVGDHLGFPDHFLRSSEKLVDVKISLGKTPYLASHCIAYVNDVLDGCTKSSNP
ncbi:hypothetical protein [Infirmifilum sp. NZ]|uniref:hypothetical protein n=1 Tax=Infirmifilum sp. NZ TaxID=2926850 RepID=UPI00279DE783|nr:hypothetical protein [Infirmifilum sp. NZ]UNQ72567.1 hypothetical protein MOV14_05440 [Infirmifilum sp. NZ]